MANCYIGMLVVCLFFILSSVLQAQVNVTTYHNDNARTGQNIQEAILTPANVNSGQFGKLFSVSVDGWVYAQPLYLSNVTISGGTHNVLYVATEHDSLYAIDAGSGTIYWQISLIPSGGSTVNSNTDLGCGDLVPEVGITGTPVIDPTTGTIYLVAKSKVNGSLVQYLHAIDVGTSAEKFGGPVLIEATVPGTASDGNGTTVSFSPHFENQRAGLLLENGHVVIGWSSHCDISPWHGWIMSYSASTLTQEAAFNTSADGSANGVWMSGGGLAADANGNIFFATGNGTWNGTTDYGDSIVKLGPPSGGSFPVLDYFTPYNQSSLAGGDTDVASGGLVLLPSLSSGQQLLTQMGKEGKMYVIDRNNMGKYCVNDNPPCNGSDPNIVQEIPGATAGVWGTPAYWNGSVYWGGGSDGGGPDNLKAFSFNANNSGLISTSPTSESAKAFSFAAPSPIISANGNTNGILWGLDDSAFGSTCSGGSNCQVLYAYDATNLANMLYNSSQAGNNRDVPGGAVKFATPIVANGKVYVGSQLKVSAYGAISATPTAATPTFSPAPGDYTSTTNVTLSDSTSGATVHCTTDGTTPTPSSPACSNVAISSTMTLKAIATANGYNPSAIASGLYTIDSGDPGINYGAGFTSTGLTFNGTAKLNGTRLRLTDGAANEAGSAFISTPINIQAFTADFGFQLSSASADGFTFTIQGVGATALGPSGGGLGYGPDTPGGTPGIASSVAVKFDIYNNAGEGTDSTGLYTDGASPTTPALDMTSSGVSLLSGDVFNVHTTYDGTTLTMTITDATNSSQTFTASWPINIPTTVGSNTAYVGFTGGTGGLTAIQEILDWTYVATGQPSAATPTFSPAPGAYNPGQVVTLSDTTTGAVIHCTTDGSTPTPSSPVCTTLTLNTTTTIQAIAVATGYNNSAIASGTFTISLPTAATPTFSPAPGAYNPGQVVTLSDTTIGAVIHCTTDGSTPTASSPVCTTLTLNTTTTIKAIAVATGYNNSAVASGTYTISTNGNPYVNYASGFSSTGLALNGSAKLNGTRLRLTDGGGTEAGSGFYATPLNIQSFTTDFSFQLTNPNADGITFVIQNVGTTALGPSGGGLGYGPDTPGGSGGIPSSVAVKFDLYNNDGEGTNSTGLYTNGASPTIPATTLGGNVNLHSGDVFNIHITYSGTTLTMTITDATTPADTFTTSWTVNIPSTVGANTAYAGFTGGTGGMTATQDILSWTFTSGAPGVTQYEATKILVTGSPNARSFTWTGFPDGAGEIADGTATGAYLNFTVNVATPGTYDIKAATKEFPTRGIFQFSVNGANVGPAEDEYNANGNGVFHEYDLGNMTFSSAGNYSFKFTVTGHNSSSSGYTVCFDYIKLTAQ
jgi:Legume lectin domain/Chitobiase/beta-hexosaminidase C-terminal domain